MNTPKDNVAPPTTISDSDYWKQNEENTRKAQDIIQAFFPELWELFRVMKEFEVDPSTILEFIYCLRIVTRHGFGSIEANVLNGKIIKIEALIRTLFHKEIEIRRRAKS